jgi:ketosteroid isomerase-like protein
MSRENVELVLSMYEAAERRDYESPFELWGEDVLWDMTGFDIPDLAKVYRGHDGIREFWGSWLAAWESLEFTKLEAEDRGDVVIVEVEQRNVGRGSGVAVEFHYFQVWTLRARKVVACSQFPTRAEALEALPG